MEPPANVDWLEMECGGCGREPHEGPCHPMATAAIITMPLLIVVCAVIAAWLP